jgi:hypothetical protein
VRLILFCLPLVFVCCFPSKGARSDDASESSPTTPEQGQSWVAWYGDNYFSSCDNNCAVSVLAGPQVETNMVRIFFTDPKPPWDWKYGDSSFVSVPFSRRLLTLWNVIDIEPEVGVGKRFGNMHAIQAWAAVYLRWTRFPWNNYLRTSIAISAGPSYAAQLPSGASHVLNDFSPEVTFASPQYPQNEFVIRFQHRSLGNRDGERDPGWQYITGGLRWRF